MSPKPKRPFGVVAIIILLFLQVVAWSTFLYLLNFPEYADLLEGVVAISEPSYFIQLSSLLLLVVALPGLWNYKRWGWILLMIQLGISLSMGIWQFIDGAPNHVGMVINVAIVFYLNQRDVQELFAPESPKEGTA